MTKCPATQLSLKHLRHQGWTCQVVEHYNPHTQRRNDLWGFVDIVALRNDQTLGVQTTSDTNVSARIRKIADSPLVTIVREAGWILHVHGWKKVGHRWVLKRCVDVS